MLLASDDVDGQLKDPLALLPLPNPRDIAINLALVRRQVPVLCSFTLD